MERERPPPKMLKKEKSLIELDEIGKYRKFVKRPPPQRKDNINIAES
jgi:hypothetical protein